MKFPKGGGGGSAIWEKFPNNSVFFFWCLPSLESWNREWLSSSLSTLLGCPRQSPHVPSVSIQMLQVFSDDIKCHSDLWLPSSPCQGLAFIQHKNALNVRDVEFARWTIQMEWNHLLGRPIELSTWDIFRGYRLTTNYIEPISFTVPRVKSTFFQVQLFMTYPCASS